MPTGTTPGEEDTMPEEFDDVEVVVEDSALNADEAEETDSEDTAVSEDEDTQSADDTADDEDEDTEDTSDESEASAKGSSAKLDKLLGKYGGDADKMVDAYFEQANSMSRLAKKLADLETKLETKAADPVEEEKYIASDPDVKEYAGELASLDADIKTAQQAQTKLIGEYGKLDREIAKLEGQLERASFEDKAEVKEMLRDKLAEKKDYERQWRDVNSELKRLQSEIRATARQYKRAEAEAKSRREREKQQELESVQGQRLTQREFVTTVRAEAKQYGLNPDTKTYAIVQQAVKDRIVGFLRTLPPNSPGIDIGAAVKKLMAEYADALELKQKFAKVSKQKTETLTQRPGSGPKKDSSGKSPTPKDAAYWRQRAARVAAG